MLYRGVPVTCVVGSLAEEADVRIGAYVKSRAVGGQLVALLFESGLGDEYTTDEHGFEEAVLKNYKSARLRPY